MNFKHKVEKNIAIKTAELKFVKLNPIAVLLDLQNRYSQSPLKTIDLCPLTKEVSQKESGHRLCYIYSRCTCIELFHWLVAPLVLKIGIHQGQTGRKGVRGGEEKGWSGGVVSVSSYRIYHLARLASSMLSPCQNIDILPLDSRCIYQLMFTPGGTSVCLQRLPQPAVV
jgi:hypothetical protein